MQISRSCLVTHHTSVVVSVQARGAGQKALRNTYKFPNPSKFKLDQRMHTRPPRRWRPPIVGHFLTHKYTTVPLSVGGQLFSAACMHDASVLFLHAWPPWIGNKLDKVWYKNILKPEFGTKWKLALCSSLYFEKQHQSKVQRSIARSANRARLIDPNNK